MFDELGVSPTRYAVTASWDKSAVSRYLSGERILPWGFVRDLLARTTRDREDEAPPTRHVVQHLHQLHRAALEASDCPAHRILLLEGKLADAAAEVERAAVRERALGEMDPVAAYTVLGRMGPQQAHAVLDRIAAARDAALRGQMTPDQVVAAFDQISTDDAAEGHVRGG